MPYGRLGKLMKHAIWCIRLVTSHIVYCAIEYSGTCTGTVVKAEAHEVYEGACSHYKQHNSNMALC